MVEQVMTDAPVIATPDAAESVRADELVSWLRDDRSSALHRLAANALEASAKDAARLRDALEAVSKIPSFTAGPWQVGRMQKSSNFEQHPRYRVGAGALRIATVEQEGDARLIALTPVMTEAIERYAKHDGNCDLADPFCACGLDAVFVAIDKAKGSAARAATEGKKL